MRYVTAGCFVLALTACQSTQVPPQEGTKNSAKQVASEEKSNVVNRITPLYPVAAAKAGEMGCATIDYVITPSLEIEKMTVIDATAKHFAQEAMNVIPKWGWSNLDEGVITEPLLMRTRFEFCLKNGEGNCTEEAVNKRTSCRGDDTMFVVGSRVKRYSF